jgi:ABC-2 type transport system ATP-binding protein
MSALRSPVVHVAAVELVVAALLVGIAGLPAGSTAVGWQLGVAAGATAGLLLFGLLAGRPWPRLALDRRRCLPLLAIGALLMVTSASEEVIWRGFVLTTLSEHLGLAGGYLGATLGFAFIHLEPRSVFVHLLTGSVFGGVMILTGSLVAAIAAHTTYNLLILLAVDSRRTLKLAVPLARGEPATRAAVEARHIVKRYGAVEALRGFDLRIERGETVALLGPNGAGKTTAVQILLGLRRPDSGHVRVLGLDPGDMHCRARVGVTMQEMSCPTALRVGEVLSFAAAHYPSSQPKAGLLSLFGLSDLERRQVGGLSGGERRRLALALGFVGAPELVFLDEPTTGLDVESRREAWGAIRAFTGAGGTVLLTTHYIEEAEALAHRIAVMRDGRVVRFAGATEITRELGTENLEDALVQLTRKDA